MRYVRALVRTAPHLAAAACVFVVAAAGAIALHLTARAVEHEYVHALAPVEISIKPLVSHSTKKPSATTTFCRPSARPS